MSHGDQVTQVSRRLRAAGHDRHLPDRRGQAQDAAGLRLAVSPRGDAHAAGREILANFLHRDLRTARGTWQLGDFAEQAIAAIRAPRRQPTA